MKVLLIGFDKTLLQEMEEKISEEVTICGVYTLEEAEQIISIPSEALEIRVIVINETLLSGEKLIAAGQFVERVRVIYQETIIAVTNVHNEWRVLKKLGATHWTPNWGLKKLLMDILNDKLKQGVTCST